MTRNSTPRPLTTAFSVAGVIAAAALLGACSDDPEPVASTTTQAADTSAVETSTTASSTAQTGESTPASAGDCKYVSTDAVTAAYGKPLVVKAAGDAMCTFTAEDGSGSALGSVTVSYVQIGIDPKEYADGTRDQCKGAVTTVNNSDADTTFACEYSTGAFAFSFAGTDSLTVEVKDLEPTSKAVAAAAKIAESLKTRA